MILVRIVSPMCEDDVRIDALFQFLEPRLDGLSLLRKEAIPKSQGLKVRALCFAQQLLRRSLGFAPTLPNAAQNAPSHIEADTSRDQAEQGPARADLYIVRMRAE